MGWVELVGLMKSVEDGLLAACRELTGGGIHRLQLLDSVNQLPDATLKFFALDAFGRPLAFVHWSNEAFPAAALAACSNSAAAKHALGEALGRFVAMPVLQGEVLSRSFAAYPVLRSPRSRVGTRLAYLLASKSVGTWLREVAVKTVRPVSANEMDALVLRPLDYIAQLQLLPVRYNVLASEGRERVGNAAWRPRVVFSHNDFWVGNVMFSSAGGWPGRPQVIDWGASAVAGIPFFDSIQYARSARLPSGMLRHAIKQQLMARQCSPLCGLFDLVAGLGRLGLNRDQFPEARFAQLAVDTVEAYKGAVSNSSAGGFL